MSALRATDKPRRLPLRNGGDMTCARNGCQNVIRPSARAETCGNACGQYLRYWANPERERQRQKIVRANDPQYLPTWKAANPNALADWKRENVEKVRGHVRRYRNVKTGAEGSHTDAEFLALVEACGNKCPRCGVEMSPRTTPPFLPTMLTEDHIQPLSKGGSDWISNIAPMCHQCNRLKKDVWGES